MYIFTGVISTPFMGMLSCTKPHPYTSTPVIWSKLRTVIQYEPLNKNMAGIDILLKTMIASLPCVELLGCALVL